MSYIPSVTHIISGLDTLGIDFYPWKHNVKEHVARLAEKDLFNDVEYVECCSFENWISQFCWTFTSDAIHFKLGVMLVVIWMNKVRFSSLNSFGRVDNFQPWESFLTHYPQKVVVVVDDDDSDNDNDVL